MPLLPPLTSILLNTARQGPTAEQFDESAETADAEIPVPEDFDGPTGS